jgi:4-amino-4-deoxy-L-arabinose transferase-like glycosyltransferase
MFWRLGDGSLEDWDEATYAQVAREMVRRGDWMTPYWNGLPFHDKPPLVYWLMAGSLTLFEPPELAVRLVPATFGIVAVGLTAYLGRLMFGTIGGLLAAEVLLVGSATPWPNLVLMARQGMLDVPLATLTIWMFVHLWVGLREHQHWVWLGLPLGLAVLTKSLAVAPILLAIVATVVSIAMFRHEVTRQHWRALGLAVIVAAAIALPWHLVELLRHGGEFLLGYMFLHADRLVEVKSNNTGSWLYYFQVLDPAVPGWAWLSGASILFVVVRALLYRDSRALLLLAWTVVPLLFFSLSATKLPWYIVPMYPALCLSIGWMIHSVIADRLHPNSLLVVGLLIPISLWNWQAIQPPESTRSVKQLSNCLVGVVRADEVVAYFDPTLPYQFRTLQRPNLNVPPAIRFYTDHPMVALTSRAEVEQWFSQGGRIVWAAPRDTGQLESLVTRIGIDGGSWYLLTPRGSTYFGARSVGCTVSAPDTVS